MVPNLIFDQPFTAEKHIAFVNQTLALRRSPKIVRFSLPLHYPDVSVSAIDHWIDFAINSNVEDLELRFVDPSFSGTDFYTLPEHIYTVSSLRKLRLDNTSVKPTGSINWKSLKSLFMNCITVSDQILDNMLNGCPVLEFLEMRLVYGFKRLRSNSIKELVLIMYQCVEEDDSGLEISAPHIQSLKIWYSLGDKLPLLSAPLLVDAHLHFEVLNPDHVGGGCLQNQKRSLQIFENFRHLEKLVIGASVIQVMSMWKVKELPSPLLNCKVLSLMAGDLEWEIPGIANLLQCVPHLETLNILYFTYSLRHCLSCNFGGEDYATLEKTIPLLDHLKVASIFVDREHLDEYDLKLLQFVLKKAKVLETMTFHPQRLDRREDISNGCEPNKPFPSKELQKYSTVLGCRQMQQFYSSVKIIYAHLKRSLRRMKRRSLRRRKRR